MCTVVGCTVTSTHHHHRVNGVRQDAACTCTATKYLTISGWTASDAAKK
jgi:hypothetical protein